MQPLCPGETTTAALTFAVQEDEDGHIVLQVVRLKTDHIHCHCPKLVLTPAATHAHAITPVLSTKETKRQPSTKHRAECSPADVAQLQSRQLAEFLLPSTIEGSNCQSAAAAAAHAQSMAGNSPECCTAIRPPTTPLGIAALVPVCSGRQHGEILYDTGSGW